MTEKCPPTLGPEPKNPFDLAEIKSVPPAISTGASGGAHQSHPDHPLLIRLDTNLTNLGKNAGNLRITKKPSLPLSKN